MNLTLYFEQILNIWVIDFSFNLYLQCMVALFYMDELQIILQIYFIFLTASASLPYFIVYL